MPHSHRPFSPCVRSWGVTTAACALALAASYRSAIAADASDPDGAALMHKTASAYAAGHAGATVFRVDTVVDISGGPMHKHEESTADYLDSGNKPIQKQFVRDVKDGRPESASELAKMDDEAEGPYSRDGARLPYKVTCLGDYVFSAPKTVPTGTLVHFKTLVRDEAHGDGDLIVDGNGLPLSVTYTPAQLPHMASTASVTLRFAEVLPGIRDVAEIDRHFTGRSFFVTGHADSNSTYSRYARFGDASKASAAFAELVSHTT